MTNTKSLTNNKLEKLLRVYASDEKQVKKIGQILASDKSREIYVILIEKELNAKEIGKLIYNVDSPPLSNLVFLLSKMVESGLVTRQRRRQRITGHKLSFYKAVPVILIVPPEYIEKISKSKSLKKTLERIFSDFE